MLIIGKETIYNSTHVKLLGITLDNDLNFEHVSGLCKKASPVIMKGIFDVKNIPYNLRTRNVRTVKNGFNTLSFRGPKIWALVLNFVRISNTLQEFKSKIRKWKPFGCDCNICKVYIPNLGFIVSEAM